MPKLKNHKAATANEDNTNLSKVDASPPELSGRVSKPRRPPQFEGTYSRVFSGEYKGQKVGVLLEDPLLIQN
jgi:hypothetical protein